MFASIWTIHPTFSAVRGTLWNLQEAAAQAADEESLTWSEVLADIPHDAAAFTLYAILAVSLYAVWWGHRNAGKSRERAEARRAEKSRDRGEADELATSRPEQPEPRPRRPAA